MMEQNQASVFNLTFRDDVIAVVTIDVPSERVNTLRAEFAKQLSDILITVQQQPSLRGVVLISGKSDSFIAGADITMLDACQTAQQAEALATQGQTLFSHLASFPVPIVAAINGACLGGGLELALACHGRVCTLNDKTMLGLPEVQLGLLPGSGGTQRLPRQVGLSKALDMMLTGRQVRAKQALKMGLVDAAVPESILLDAAIQLIAEGLPLEKRISWQERILNGPFIRSLLFKAVRKKTLAKTQGNYPAPEAILNVVAVGMDEGMGAGLEAEAKAFGKLVMTPESAALRSLFFATTSLKKEPGADAQPLPIERVGILGGGLMGGGIAYVSASKAGLSVRIKDISKEGILNALRYSWDLLDKKVRLRHMRRADQQNEMNRLSGTTDYSGFSSVDVVIEAVFEDLALKRQMVAEVEQNAASRTIFASNTSSLPIAKIAEGANRPEQVIGLHYFSPVDKMPLVEVIPHAATSAATIATTVSLAHKQGKTAIVVGDTAGFYVNRILAPYINESLRCLLDGEQIEAIDNTLVQFGFPVGPITLLDEVGIDVGTKIIPILVEELGDRFAAPSVLDAILKDDRKGRKNGRGFYFYDKTQKAKSGKSKKADETIYTLLGVTQKSYLNSELTAQRCVMLMLNEAARCLAEGVIRNARDGDIGAVFGIGFPPFLGGPFHYMDRLGVSNVVNILDKLSARYGERFTPCPLLVEMAGRGEAFYPKV